MLKAFDTRGILSTPASDVDEGLKTNGTAIKRERLLTINKRNVFGETVTETTIFIHEDM